MQSADAAPGSRQEQFEEELLEALLPDAPPGSGTAGPLADIVMEAAAGAAQGGSAAQQGAPAAGAGGQESWRDQIGPESRIFKWDYDSEIHYVQHGDSGAPRRRSLWSCAPLRVHAHVVCGHHGLWQW